MEDFVEDGYQDEHKRIQAMTLAYGLDCEEIPPFCTDPFGLQDFRPAVLKIWVPRVAVALLLHLLGLYSNNVAQAWLQAHISGYYENRWIPNPKFTNHTVIMYDVSFEYLPYFPDTTPADIIAALPAIICIVRFLIFAGPMSLRWTIVCRVLIMWGVLWVLRGLCIVTTPLPNPDFTCVPRITYPDNVFLEAFAIFPGLIADDLTCQDVMFSGHTVGMTLWAQVAAKYWSKAPWRASDATEEGPGSFNTFIDAVMILIVIAGMYFIIASHFHYTVDVIVAAVLACLVFNAYHRAIEICWSRKQHWSRIPARAFLKWLEFNSKDNMLYRRSCSPQHGRNLIGSDPQE